MTKVARHMGATFIALATFAQAPVGFVFTTPAWASPDGDECRRQICDAVVADCMRSDMELNPLARTESERKVYCSQFHDGCMKRTIVPDLSWYTPDTVSRFLKCPS